MSNSEFICPVCGDGELRSHVDMEQSTYKDCSELTPIHLSTCDTCGTIQTTAQQARDNRRIFIAFKKRVDGLLSGAEIKRIRLSHNISQINAAKLFGGGPVAFAKYEADDVMQSESMDKLIRVYSEIPQAKKWLQDLCNATIMTPTPLAHAMARPLKRPVAKSIEVQHIITREIADNSIASILKGRLVEGSVYARNANQRFLVTEHYTGQTSENLWQNIDNLIVAMSPPQFTRSAHVILNKKYDMEDDENLNHSNFKTYSEQDYDRYTAKN